MFVAGLSHLGKKSRLETLAVGERAVEQRFKAVVKPASVGYSAFIGIRTSASEERSAALKSRPRFVITLMIAINAPCRTPKRLATAATREFQW